MPKDLSNILDTYTELFDIDKILSEDTFDRIKKVVNFEKVRIYTISPNELTGIYPTRRSKYISDKLSKGLYKGCIEHSEEISKKRHYITYLKVITIIYGIAVFEDGEFDENSKNILNAFTKIISYKIKDEELSEVFKTQLKTLSEAITKSKTAEKIKTDFIANVSHELRTPLNAIIGFSDLLQNKRIGELNEKQTGYVKDIQASSINLLGMINEILDISKLENSSTQLVKQTFDISMVINEVTTLLYPLFEKKNIKLIKNIEEFEINADYQKIKQVLFNLLSNALKFTKNKIKIIVQKIDSKVVIKVIDNGIGIEKKNQKKIFNKFTQINDYSTKNESSTGLGLTISKEFVKLHNGKIEVESELNKGATFIITLPID